MVAMSTVISEGQSNKPILTTGVYYGYTAYSHDDGTFTMVYRNRTYEPGGMKVQDKWDSEPVPLTSTTKEAAIQEARENAVNYARAMAGVGA